MIQPVENLLRMIDLMPVGHGGPVDHQNRQAKGTRGDQLGLCAGAARIFAHDQINGVFLQKRTVPIGCKGAAIHHKVIVWQFWCDRRAIDKAQQIMMVRLPCELRDVHAPQGQHDAARRPVKRGNGSSNIGHMAPVVPGLSLPCRTGQGDQGNSSKRRRFDRMGAHRRSKGMRCVNHMGYSLFAQIGDKPRHAAKSTDADRHGLGARMICSPCIAERGCNRPFVQHTRKDGGFGRSAQQQDIMHG